MAPECSIAIRSTTQNPSLPADSNRANDSFASFQAVVKYLTILVDLGNLLMVVAGAMMFLACAVGLVLYIFNIQSPFTISYVLCFGYFITSGVLIFCGVRPLLHFKVRTIEEKVENILVGYDWFPYCLPVLASTALLVSSSARNDVGGSAAARASAAITDWIATFILTHGGIHLAIQSLLLLAIANCGPVHAQSWHKNLQPFGSYVNSSQAMAVVQLVVGQAIVIGSIVGIPSAGWRLVLLSLLTGLALCGAGVATLVSIALENVHVHAFGAALLSFCLYLEGGLALLAVLSYNEGAYRATAMFTAAGLNVTSTSTPEVAAIVKTLSGYEGRRSLVSGVDEDLLARLIFCFGIVYGMTLFMSWTLQFVRRQGQMTFRTLCS